MASFHVHSSKMKMIDMLLAIFHAVFFLIAYPNKEAVLCIMYCGIVELSLIGVWFCKLHRSLGVQARHFVGNLPNNIVLPDSQYIGASHSVSFELHNMNIHQ